MTPRTTARGSLPRTSTNDLGRKKNHKNFERGTEMTRFPGPLQHQL